MSIGIVVFLAGLFAVPLALLWWGQRVRKGTARQRRTFWGAIIGHCVAGILAVTFSMIPPESWTDSESTRGFFGLWALLLFPLMGGFAAALRPPSRR